MHEKEDILRDDLLEFVSSLYEGDRVRSLSKTDIMAQLRKHEVPKEVGFLFGRLPDASYDQAGLIGALGDLANRDKTFGAPRQVQPGHTDTLDEGTINY